MVCGSARRLWLSAITCIAQMIKETLSKCALKNSICQPVVLHEGSRDAFSKKDNLSCKANAFYLMSCQVAAFSLGRVEPASPIFMGS